MHACIANRNGTGNVQTFYNTGLLSRVLNATDRSIGVSNTVVIVNGHYLTCAFSRLKAVPGVNEYYDLENPYFLLAATGMANNPSKSGFLALILRLGSKQLASFRRDQVPRP